tara:strand:+ start:2731 stop:3096 length:366 start_codon:yes stop_codon:yes gene_type:complete
MGQTLLPTGTELTIYPCKTHGFHNHRLCNKGTHLDSGGVQSLLREVSKDSAVSELFLSLLKERKIDDVTVSKSKQVSLMKLSEQLESSPSDLGLDESLNIWHEGGANAIDIVFTLPVTEAT